MVNLAVRIGKITMKNPITVGSGCFSLDYEALYSPDILGAYVPKTIRAYPWPGNPPPRITETPSGVLSSVGIPSKGWAKFLEEDVPALKALKTPVILSVVGRTEEEYAEIVEFADGLGFLAGIELNLSCPNVKAGGLQFGADSKMAYDVVARCRKKTDLTLIPKLPPDPSHIVEVARAVEAAGADAIAMINSPKAMLIDIETKKPFLGNVIGALSGPAIRPMAVAFVYQVYEQVGIPIIGMGGVTTVRDVIEFLLAGAQAVALGVVNFFDPLAVPRILDGLQKYLEEKGIEDVNSLVGAAHSF
ncbi:MAG TPA: dihydroorotate dehydrogenase [Firmicutes bacterium]|nr:dihydroorotate dehydrogenase [Bacillota bacterium]